MKTYDEDRGARSTLFPAAAVVHVRKHFVHSFLPFFSVFPAPSMLRALLTLAEVLLKVT